MQNIIVFALTAICTNASIAACIPAPISGEDVKLLGSGRSVRLVSQDNVDNPMQSTLSQKYAFIGTNGAPAEAEARAALSQLYSNALGMCRRAPLKGVQIFLYTSPTTSIGSAWVGRIAMENARLAVNVHANMVRSTESGQTTCDSAKEPGKSLHLYPKLPPLDKRKVLGTWVDDRALTVSLEETRGTVYKVYRSKYCSSGAEGIPLRRAQGGRFYVRDSSAGDYYKILPGGELGVYDNDGQIDARPVHKGLYPQR